MAFFRAYIPSNCFKGPKMGIAVGSGGLTSKMIGFSQHDQTCPNVSKHVLTCLKVSVWTCLKLV